MEPDASGDGLEAEVVGGSGSVAGAEVERACLPRSTVSMSRRRAISGRSFTCSQAVR